MDGLRLEDVMELNEARRPGIRAIASALRQKNPGWDADRLGAEAKVVWHAKDDERRRVDWYAKRQESMPDCPEGGKCCGALACCIKYMDGETT